MRGKYFIAFAGNIPSKVFTRKVRDSFRASSTLPVESLNTFSIVPGVNFSDHWTFWKFGYPAIMITDTALYCAKDAPPLGAGRFT